MKATYIKHIRTFVSACKLRENMPDLLKRYGVEWVTDLSEEHAYELYKWLEIAHRQMTTEPTTEVRRMRSKILVLLNKIGIGVGNNWAAINAYLLQPKIAEQLLYMMNAQELYALEKKLYGIIEKAKKPRPAAPSESVPVFRTTQPS